MCTCIHVYMYTRRRVYMYTCEHVYIWTCIHVYMYTCVHEAPVRKWMLCFIQVLDFYQRSWFCLREPKKGCTYFFTKRYRRSALSCSFYRKVAPNLTFTAAPLKTTPPKPLKSASHSSADQIILRKTLVSCPWGLRSPDPPATGRTRPLKKTFLSGHRLLSLWSN